MKPVDFAYSRLLDTADVALALSAHGGRAKIMAGGQTLGPMLNLRFVQPEIVIDISGIAALKTVELSPTTLDIGACTTHASFEDGIVPDATRGMMRRVASRIAYRAVRTRGTIGGSLAHADPAADWVSCLTALRATIRVIGPTGRRDIAIENFIKGPLDTALGEDELIERVIVPKLGGDARWGYHKICRKTGEFAEAIGAVLISSGTARMIAGAVAGRPVALEVDASTVAGGAMSTEDLKAKLAAAGLSGDTYDMSIHVAAVRRALEEALAQ